MNSPRDCCHNAYTTKAELEHLVEEHQRKLENIQQSKESIEAVVQATMTSHLKEDLARAVAAKRKRTNVEQQLLEAMQKTIDGLQSGVCCSPSQRCIVRGSYTHPSSRLEDEGGASLPTN